ncbi:AAA family ATPase [Pedobacter sp. MR22-3]|uniref:AAA family ATPase n=1 Tax=Pedobacter sp. MR22-3 TaxID=2994552 RepID=UPI00224580BF|nr:hypothetical protein [Pedobacter sp. MR22-3]MCX2584134.1 hypothetical protein [Pedobacter sp. MR22-3]
MNKLKLEDFKAFEGELILSLDRKNLLLYGENGAGKSSLYESIRTVFFSDRLESSITAQTPEDLLQLQNEFWSSFNNKISNRDFKIEINDTVYRDFDASNYQVFLISIEELLIENKLNLKSLLEKFCISIDNIEDFCTDSHEQVESEVNLALSSFLENVKIEIDEEEQFDIKIIDTERNIERKSEIRKYFNEAKLNLIPLLILLNVAYKVKDNTKSKILVLDDFITSLDSSNRTFLIKYILDKFQDTQILIFTHNISFYNLIMYVINEIELSNSKWVFANLFEIKNKHKLYIKSEIERVKTIKEAFENLSGTPSQDEIEGIGNRIRKKFEILLYEYSKLLMVGAVEDSRKILDRITNGKSSYYLDKKTASDLIDSIENILAENNDNNLISRLQNLIETYKNLEFANFQKILKELKLYQKVTMHPMSHGITGMPTFTTKEISNSLILLQKMEDYLKEIVNTNIASV